MVRQQSQLHPVGVVRELLKCAPVVLAVRFPGMCAATKWNNSNIARAVLLVIVELAVIVVVVAIIAALQSSLGISM